MRASGHCSVLLRLPPHCCCRRCKPKGSACAADADCCQSAGALFCRPVVPGSAPKCVSRPSKPIIASLRRVLREDGSLAAFALLLQPRESGIVGARIDRFEVTATGPAGVPPVVINSTSVRWLGPAAAMPIVGARGWEPQTRRGRLSIRRAAATHAPPLPPPAAARRDDTRAEPRGVLRPPLAVHRPCNEQHGAMVCRRSQLRLESGDGACVPVQAPERTLRPGRLLPRAAVLAADPRRVAVVRGAADGTWDCGRAASAGRPRPARVVCRPAAGGRPGRQRRAGHLPSDRLSWRQRRPSLCGLCWQSSDSRAVYLRIGEPLTCYSRPHLGSSGCE